MKTVTQTLNPTMQEFYANATKVACDTLIPGAAFCSYNSHAVYVDVNGVNKFVNFCGKDYALIPNSTIFPQLEEELLKAGFDFEVSYKTVDSSKFYVDYTFKGQDYTVGSKKDTLQSVMRIQHSYNSRLQYTITFGAYRQICSNGLWGMKMEQQINLSHSNGNTERIIAGTIASAQTFSEDYLKIKDGFALLSEQKIKHYAERIAEVMEFTKFHKVEGDIIARLELEAKTHKLPITDWLIYNAFNYQLNHNTKIGMQEELKMKLDRKVFEYLSNSEALLD